MNIIVDGLHAKPTKAQPNDACCLFRITTHNINSY